MKRILNIFFACCILQLSVVKIHAQDPINGQYELTVKFNSFVNIGNDMKNFDYKIWTSDGGDYYYFNRTNVGGADENHTIPHSKTPASYTYTAGIRPSVLKFYVRRKWGRSKYSDYNNQYVLSSSDVYIDTTISKGTSGGDLFGLCSVSLDVKLYPKKIDIGYYNSDGIADGKKHLPDNDLITLKATKGFIPNTYAWQYATNENGPWNNFPPSMQNKSEITFKGTDLHDIIITDYKSLVENNTNIFVRINTPTSQQETPFVLTLLSCLSAPHISDIAVQEFEKCYGSDDAKVRITFDRALINGEMISVKIDNMIPYGGGYYTSLDATNSIVIENVEAGNRTFTVTGTYNAFDMFTGANSFSKTIAIAKRPQITHSIINIKNVSCNGGSDGEIILDAGGGTGNFTGKLYIAGESTAIQEVAFNESELATFSRLATGNYEVRISDTNGCIAYSNGTELIHQITVNEPAQPASVTLEHKTSPLAFDSHDGKVTIRISGGTPGQSGYTAILMRDGVQSYTPTSQSKDGGDVLYTFTGLPQGSYYVTVQDSNFASLDPQDRIDPCGCSAGMSFFLDAPPPIEVSIEETHFVNWYGGNQGELMAHATGGIQLPSAMPYKYEWYKESGAGVMQAVTMPSDSIAYNLTAGLYQVKVTDANGISKSANYNLTQPDQIRVQFAIVQTGCQGGSSGRVTANVSGGVEPYQYQWNVEGAAENEIASLAAGIYMLKITDVRGGLLLANAEVTSASTLKVDSLVVQPSCVALGSIELQLSGATPPYVIKWDDTNSTDLIRSELMPGIYRISVTDANNCINAFSFNLKEPKGFTINLGGDLVMCRNQTRTVEAICNEPGVVYEWYLNGAKLFDTEDRITVDREGVYSVKATNTQGCFASDQINVRMTGETLDLDMAVPTIVEVGSEIHAVNLSKVSADRIMWKVPEEAAIISQSDMELVFSIARKGSYTVSMEGFKGEGATIVTRTIDIVDKGQVSLPDSEEPLIKQFWVTPNPSTGYFKVVVELNQAEDFTMLLFSPQGVEMDRKEVKTTQSKTFEYEINGTLQGTYLLHLITKADKSVLQVVIEK